MRRFVYPVDTDQFQQIREDGKVYVDKTGMVYDIVNVKKYKYVFLARPRRFGKSLLCNTFKAYFQGKKQLFEGLKIMELEKEWKTHPVLHFDMSDLKNYSIPEAKSNIEAQLRTYEAIYGNDPKSITIGARLRDLIHNANRMTGEKVVVIFDEYDAPIMRLLYSDDLEEMRTLLRGFYQVVKKEGEFLKFVFITGVTKFSQLSIFSELNNLVQISMDDDYSGLCGITQKELDTVLRPCVEEYAEALKITVDEAYALLKRNYDGYHFSANSEDVYAPFSLLRALDQRNSACYWFESGTMTSLIEHLRHYPKFNPLDFDGVELELTSFNVPCEYAPTPVPLLYQSGYLTIDYYNREDDVYVLHFPNYEVRQSIVGGLTNYLMDTDDISRDASILAMSRCLNRSNLSGALTELRSFIASLPYDIITRKEWMEKKKREDFYKMLMYIIFSLLNNKVETEVKSILGRADVVIKTKNDIYVLELKVDDSVDNALAQIDSKGYAIPFESDGRKVTKCGVVISSEARNFTHWRVVDAEGNVIDEQKF